VTLAKSLLTAATIVWILTALTGCATMKPTAAPQKPAESWETRQVSLSRLQNWQLNGKIAVITANDSGSASIDWSQRADTFKIALYGPLGTNGMTLNGAPGRVTMQTSDGKKASAASAEQLLASQWGWHLPVSSLKYWVRGLPVPNSPQQSRFDNNNRLLALNQQGFNIQFAEYTQRGTLELPQRLTITSPTLKSKIVIYSWNIG
jgi:outer membrane lipoprotein LolB